MSSVRHDRRAPPQSEAELLLRTRALAGASLAELAARAGVEVPPSLHRAKGFTGNLLERLLGANAGSRAEPDFVELGVELKTLPVDRFGAPLESTFVCTIDLSEMSRTEWASSRVRAKLSRVLWVPIEGTRSLAPALRRVGQALLWSPTEREEQALRFDWEELSGRIARADWDGITGHLGKYLQVRPKAKNGAARRHAVDAEGGMHSTLPRGFYLRTAFTAAILRQNYALGSVRP